jgi:hypothetical protein
MDLRTPSGYFFALLGAILVLVAVLPPEETAPLLSANVNLYSGAFMLLFGGFLLYLARRSKQRA